MNKKMNKKLIATSSVVLVALLLSLPMIASAQQPTVVVSNLGERSAVTGRGVIFNNSSDRSKWAIANAFTTGAETYAFQSVTIVVNSRGSAATDMEVAIHAAEGLLTTDRPADLLQTLTGPARPAGGTTPVYSLPAGEMLMLAANTQYFMVITIADYTTGTNGSNFYQMDATLSVFETAIPGWQIADDHWRNNGYMTAGFDQWNGQANPLRFAVTATPASGERTLPTADAGPDQPVAGQNPVHSGDMVTLDGSGSSSTDTGSTLTYSWRGVMDVYSVIRGTRTLTGERILTEPTTPVTTSTFSFTAPEVTENTEVTYILTVTESDGDIDNDRVTVTVMPMVQAPPASIDLLVDTDPVTEGQQTTLPESAGETVVTVTASISPSGATFDAQQTVTVSVALGTASAGDFATALPGALTITIAPGEPSGETTLTLTPNDDVQNEIPESVILSGELASDAGFTIPDVTLTLSDDDEAPPGIVLSVDTDSMTAGDQSTLAEGAGPTLVTVTAQPQGPTTYRLDRVVRVSVAGDGEAGAVDFAAVEDFTITLAAGAASSQGTFTLTPEPDIEDETDVALTISGALTGVVTSGVIEAATLTLTDDDAPPAGIALSLDRAATSENTRETGSAVRIGATVQGATRYSTDLTVMVTAVSGSGAGGAILGTDFTTTSGIPIIIPAGEQTGEQTSYVVVTAVDDTLDENDETFMFTGSVQDRVDIAVTGVSYTVRDNDGAASEIALYATTQVGEGRRRTLSVRAFIQGDVFPEAHTVDITLTDSGVVGAVPYTLRENPMQRITIPANMTSGLFEYEVTLADNNVDELDEILTLSGVHVPPTGSALTVLPTTVRLIDNDPTPRGITLSTDMSEVQKGAGAATVTVTATVQGNTRFRFDQTVTVSVAGDTASAGDFTASPSDFNIVIPAMAGSMAGTFTLTAIEDNLYEEQLTVTVSGLASNQPSDFVTSDTITLTDTAPTIVLSVDTNMMLEGVQTTLAEGAGVTAVGVTAMVQGVNFRAPQTIAVQAVSGTAVLNSDFTMPSPFSLLIPANTASAAGTFMLVPTQDSLFERNEMFTVGGALTVGDVAISITSAGIILLDDDPQPDTAPAFADDAAIASQLYITGAPVMLTLPQAIGGNGAITYALAGTLPTGLTFNAAARPPTITGTPTAVMVGTMSYMARDADLNTDTSDTATLMFQITVEVDAVPAFANGASIPAQTWTQGMAIAPITLPQATGGNGATTYALTSPPGTGFDPDTRVLSGTPAAQAVATMYTYTAADSDGNNAAGDTVTLMFQVTVNSGDAVPIFDGATVDHQTYLTDVPVMLTLPEAIGGNAPIGYTLSGALPTGLTFNGAARPPTITGTPTAAFPRINHVYFATDTDNDRAMLEFAITVEADTAPAFADGVTIPSPQIFTQGTASTPLTFPEATGGNGALTYAITAPSTLPAGLTFDAATRVLSGRSTSTGTTTLQFTLTVTDADDNEAETDSARLVFEVNLVALDTPPIFADGKSLAIVYVAGQAVDQTLPVVIADTGNAPVMYTLTPALPTGLTFNAGVRPRPTITGMPTAAATTEYTYTATDGDGNTAMTDTDTLEFTITVEADTAPAFAADASIPLDFYPQHGIISPLTFPEATGGNGDLTYTLTTAQGVLPAGLTFNGDLRPPTLTGTPSVFGGSQLTYTVTDADGNTAAGDRDTLTFTFTVAESDRSLGFPDMINFGLEPAAGRIVLYYTRDQAITPVTFPAATGGIAPLSYSVIGGRLPTGLTFDADGRVLSGTPTAPGVGIFTYRVTDSAMPPATVTVGAMIIICETGGTPDGLTNCGLPSFTTLAFTTPAGMTFENTRPVTSVTLPAATGGYSTNAVRIYTATPLPPGLTFDPMTRAITGTPTTIGSTTVNYRVVDAGEAVSTPRSTTVTFDIVVAAVVNTAPTAFTLSLNPAAVAESADSTDVTATVTLTGGTFTVARAFQISTQDGTAMAGTDYTAVSATNLTIPAMSVSGTVIIPFAATPDTDVEASGETVTFQSSFLVVDEMSNDNSLGSAAEATLTINDPPVVAPTGFTLSVVRNPGAVTVTTVLEGVTQALNAIATPTPAGSVFAADQTITFTVTPAPPASPPANAADPYVAYTAITPGTIALAVGAENAVFNFSLATTDDALDHMDFPLTITATASPSGLTATTILTLLDNDIRITTSAASASAAVGATATYSVQLSEAPPADTTVTVASQGTATATVSPATLTFTTTNWNTARAVTVTGVAVGSTTIRHSAPAGGFTFVTNDVAVTVTAGALTPPTSITLSATPATVVESADPTDITVTATLVGGGYAEERVVIVDTQAGTGSTADPVVDYTALSGTNLTIPANMSSGSVIIPFTARADTRADSGETVRFRGRLRDATGMNFESGIDAANATITINDPSGPATGFALILTDPVSGLSVTEVGEGGTPSINATVTPTPAGSVFAAEQVVTLTAPTPPTRPANAADPFVPYTAVTPVTLTVAANSSARVIATLSLSIQNDAFDHADFPLTITATATPSGAIGTTILTLRDNDIRITTSAASASADVGATATYDVQLSEQPPTATTVTVASQGVGTATVSPATLTFTTANWNTARTVTVTGVAVGSTTISHSAPTAGGFEYVTNNVGVTVTVADTAPAFADGASIADQSYLENSPITALTLPEATGGTGPITYTLTPAIPGLTLNPNTGILTGTPTTAATTVEYTYEADDSDGNSADSDKDTLMFSITVNADIAPTFGTATIADQSFMVGETVDLTLPGVTGGTGNISITYALTPALPDGLTFNAGVRPQPTITGTPTGTAATMEYTYMTTDGDGNTAVGDTDMLTFNIVVTSSTLVFTGNVSTLTLYYPLGAAITATTFPAVTGGTSPYIYDTPAGATLPAGLTFDAANRILSGTPTTAGSSSFNYRVTDNAMPAAIGFLEVTTVICESGGAADGGTVCATPAFVTLALPTPAEQAFRHIVSIAPVTLPEATGGSGANPVRIYTAMPLPVGMEFDPATRVISGRPENIGTFTVNYRVGDAGAGNADAQSTTVMFDIVVFGRPSLAVIPDQVYVVGDTVAHTLPVATAGSPPYTYALTDLGFSTLTLPAGLTWNMGVSPQTITGMPTAVTALANYRYDVTDSRNLRRNRQFSITVNAAPDTTPAFAADASIADQFYTVGTAIEPLTLPEATGGNAPLAYSLLAPPGLNFDLSTRVLSGTPTTAATVLTYSYVARDADTDSVSLPIMITVNAADTAPVFTNAVAFAMTIEVPEGMSTVVSDNYFAATATGTVTYTLRGANSSGFTISPTGTVTFTTAPNFEQGTGGPGFDSNDYTFTVRALAGGMMTDVSITVRVTDVNEAPGSAAITIADGATMVTNPATLGVSATATDPDAGTTLTYTWSSDATGDSFAPATGTSTTWTPPTVTAATVVTLTVTVSDGATPPLTTTATQEVTVNAMPAAGVRPTFFALASTTFMIAEGTAMIAGPTTFLASAGSETVALTLSGPDAGLFSVTDAGALTFNTAPDFEMPRGMPFVAGTNTNTYRVTITATATPGGLTRDAILTIRVTDVDETPDPGTDTAPTFGAVTISPQVFTIGTAVDLTLPVATGGNGAITYALTPAIPGLTLDAATRALTGTPTTAATATDYTYTAGDTDGSAAGTDEATLTISITVNEMTVTPPAIPTFGDATIDDMTYTQGTTITPVTLPVATGGDTTLFYSVISAALPAGLTFTPATRVLSGTPTTVGMTTHSYRVADIRANAVALMFTITVNAPAGGGTAPTSQTLTISPTAVTESATPTNITATVTLNGGTFSIPRAFSIGAQGGTAAVDDDYAAVNLTLTLPANTASGSLIIPFTAVLDTVAEPDGETVDITSGLLDLAENGRDLAIPGVTATLTINDAPASGDTAPSFGGATVSDQFYAQGTAITPLTLPVATGGNGAITYTLAPALPTGLIFNAAARTITGTASTVATATDYTYTAGDTDGSAAGTDEVSLMFSITVEADTAPDFGTTTPFVPSETIVQNRMITPITLPAATGGNGPIIYTLPALPAGLTFDAATGVISGTPESVVAVMDYTYTAADSDDSTGAGDEDTLVVRFEVMRALPTGIRLSVTPAEVTESSAATTVTVTATLLGGTFAEDRNVTFASTDGTATSADYTAVPDTTLTIPADMPSGSVDIMFTAGVDMNDESAGETVIITGTLFDADGTTPTPSFDVTPATLTINDYTLVVNAGDDQTVASGGTITLNGEVTGSTDITTAWALSDSAATRAALVEAGLTTAEATTEVGRLTTALGAITTLGGTLTAPAVSLGLTDSVALAFTLMATDSTPPAGQSAAMAMDTVTITVEANTTAVTTTLNEAILPEVTRALVHSTSSSITRRVGQAVGSIPTVGSFNLAGQQMGGERNLASALRTHGEAMSADSRDIKEMLAGSDFVLPLNATAGSVASSMAFWGSGEYRDFSGESDDLDWDGDLTGFQLGLDARLRNNLLVGVAVSMLETDVDYEDDTGILGQGDYELDLTSAHPYIGWRADELDLWATVGYGTGDLEITGQGASGISQAPKSGDVNLQTIGGGGSGMLWQSGLRQGSTTTLRLKGEVSQTQLEVEGSDDFAEQEIDATGMRIAVEATRSRRLAGGGIFEPSVEVAARYDGGDGETGGGAEVGGALRYRNPATGLTADGRIRALVGQGGNYEEWGISGTVRVAPGTDGQGLSFSLSPGYGNSGSGVQELWRQGLTDDDRTDTTDDYAMRVDARVGYGFGFALNDRHGILTPYSEMTRGTTDSYRMGLNWAAGTRFDLTLLGERSEPATDPVGHAVLLKGEVRF